MTCQMLGTFFSQNRLDPPAFLILLGSPARYETQGSPSFKDSS